MISISSRPRYPPSPPCGLSPATSTRGAAMPNSGASASHRMRRVCSRPSRSRAAGTSFSARCVVASATRRPPPVSIITTLLRAGALGEILGVPDERNPGVVDHALVHRRRHHGGELAARCSRRAPGRAGRGRKRSLRGSSVPGRAGAASGRCSTSSDPGRAGDARVRAASPPRPSARARASSMARSPRITSAARPGAARAPGRCPDRCRRARPRSRRSGRRARDRTVRRAGRS